MFKKKDKVKNKQKCISLSGKLINGFSLGSEKRAKEEINKTTRKMEVQRCENSPLLVKPKYFLFPINHQRKDNGWNSQQSTNDKKIMKSKIFNYKSRAAGNKPWGNSN